MLASKSNCVICKAVKADRKLLQRLYSSSFYVPGSKDSLLNISQTTNLGYQSLKNHVKKHQFIDSHDYQEKMMSIVDKKAQNKAVQQAVQAVDAVQKIINLGVDQIDENTKISVGETLRASQIKIQHEDKQKDRQVLMLDMIAHFISGESESPKIAQERKVIDADPS